MPNPKLTSRSVDVKSCPGGLAIWGTVEAIFDTSRPPRQEGFERGIHVHARMQQGGHKHINTTHNSVEVRNLPYEGLETIRIDLDLAIYFVVLSAVQNSGTLSRFVARELAKVSNGVDRIENVADEANQRFSAKFGPPERALVEFLTRLNQARPVVRPRRHLDISANDLRSGVQLWGSNKAMIWLGSNNEEEGIHVHGFDERGKISIDGTFDSISILGRSLDDAQARQLMAQAQFPEVTACLVSLSCKQCGHNHFDGGIAGLIPHAVHVCESCGGTIDQSEARRTVSNPAVAVLRTAELEAGVRSRTPPLSNGPSSA